MLIKAFAKGRNVEPHTVATYIRRHPEAFEGHIQNDGKKILLDEEAIHILDEIYPLPKPVELIHDPALTKELVQLSQELREIRGKYDLLRDENIKLKGENYLLEAGQQKLIGEVKDELSQQHKKETKILEGFIQDAKREIEVLQKEKIEQKREADQEIEDLRRQLAAETQRREEAEQKTWFQKLIGR